MSDHAVCLLDIVALLMDMPECWLRRGQVGTVVEELCPSAFEVEFSHDNGKTYAMLAIPADKLITLHYEPS